MLKSMMRKIGNVTGKEDKERFNPHKYLRGNYLACPATPGGKLPQGEPVAAPSGNFAKK
jgi:hypothetical protein